MIKLNFSKKLFYLLLLLLPCNLAKHFILDSSYVNGLLVDYLIPTIYLTDIVLVLMLVAWGIEKVKSPRRGRGRHQSKVKSEKSGIRSQKSGITNYELHRLSPATIFLFLLITLSGLSILQTSNKIAAIYKFIRLLEYTGFYFYVVKNIDLKKEWGRIIKILTIGALFQSALVIIQWFKQSSIFGYWFFGEPVFNVSTPGIARIGFFGKLKVRPYGTFPHPNALGGYLAIILVLMFNHLITNYQLPITKKIFNFQFSIFNYLSIFILFTALLLTFSRSAIFVGLLGILISTVLLYRKRNAIAPGQPRSPRMTRLLWLFVFLCFCVFVFLCVKLDFDTLSFVRRKELIQVATSMIKAYPFTGIGLNNFTVVMQNYGSVSGLARFLQPAHNVYLLIASETGILSLIVFLLFLASRVPKMKRILLVVLLQILTLMFLDHYFWTLQQTSLLFWLVLGLSKAKKAS